MAERKGLLDTKAAAAWLGIASSTLNSWRCLGRSPRHAKIGARVLYDPDDLATFCDERKRRSTSDSGPDAAA